MPTPITYILTDTPPLPAGGPLKPGMRLTGGYPVTLPDGTLAVRFAEKVGKQQIAVRYEVRPDLNDLVTDYLIEQSQEQAAREERWRQDAREQAAKDAPLLAAMREEAAGYTAMIPVDHVPVEVRQVGSADGDPVNCYTAGGLVLRWDAPIVHHGTACAVRPGALAAFDCIRVSSIHRDDLEAIRAAQKAAADAFTARQQAEGDRIESARLLAAETGRPQVIESELVNGREGFERIETLIHGDGSRSTRYESC